MKYRSGKWMESIKRLAAWRERRREHAGGSERAASRNYVGRILRLPLRVRVVMFAIELSQRAAERVNWLVKTRRPESSEIVNCFFAFGWFMSCVLNPTVLQSSIYYQEIEKHLPRGGIITLAGILLIYWLVCLVFGGEPSALLRSERHRDLWVIARITGFGAAIFCWVSLAGIVTLPGLNFGTFLWLGAALWSFMCLMQMSWYVSIDRLAASERERDRKQNPRMMMPVAVARAATPLVMR